MLKRIESRILSVLLVLAAVLNVTSLIAGETPGNPIAQSVISNQIQSFRAGNHEQAFGYASPNLQRIFGSVPNFIRMVKKGYGAIYGAQSWSFGRSRIEAGTLYQEVVVVGPKGKNWVALYSLQRQPDGSWKITAVQMKKTDAQST